MKKYRKFITSAVGFTFLVVGTTGVTFRFFFKNHVLQDIHGWLGVAMVVAACFHIFQNLGSIRGYLRDPRVWSLVVPIFLVIIYFGFIHKETNRGVNTQDVVHKLLPGRATDIAKAFGKDVNTILASMTSDGVRVTGPEETIEAIGRDNKRRPESILLYFVN